MKITFSLCLFAIICIAISISEATQARHKRAIARQFCPQELSTRLCEEYAKSISKTLKYCHTYDIYDDVITWINCGTVLCPGNLKVVEEDLSKPYPQCCKTCTQK
ncbi:uncharacterized protein LOC131668387 [Phymastichus coffea]|uniref:uncharacterized protein LOC131668387 n=1 Tax=Phymastichus coffea TaxID=108790 RepID=UPI00273CAFF7|nr:uncharacterized protein LOC131668387 [Phymastichus coffea]